VLIHISQSQCKPAHPEAHTDRPYSGIVPARLILVRYVDVRYARGSMLTDQSKVLGAGGEYE
jgi:hypothetical protein